MGKSWARHGVLDLVGRIWQGERGLERAGEEGRVGGGSEGLDCGPHYCMPYFKVKARVGIADDLLLK